ncbi:MAG: hypothetical protein M0Q51_17250 [Bacteroidales bacterium]|nr:hypothetical protein [Bacteroidales bacterium]
MIKEVKITEKEVMPITRYVFGYSGFFFFEKFAAEAQNQLYLFCKPPKKNLKLLRFAAEPLILPRPVRIPPQAG